MSTEETQVTGPDRTATVLQADPVALDGIPSGTLLVNTYRVERPLGGGGMGEVYLARHLGLGTLHAIKIIRPAMAENRQVMDLFYREAKVLRGVRHEAVVSYDGFVRDDLGRDYLVMEYVDGPSLADRLRRGPLSESEVLVLRDRLAAGLAEAHRKGAVHRDISPDNVILPGDRLESATLIDFGVCKLTDPTQGTILGSAFAGKYRYASPEQLGLFGGAVDARSDIYSLGLVLASAAEGRPLFVGDTIEAAVRRRQILPDLSFVPVGLRTWLSSMLQPDPARRPESMDALLARWPAGAGLRPATDFAPEGQTGSGSTGRRGRTILQWGIGLVVLGGIAAGFYRMLWPLPDAEGPRAPTTQPWLWLRTQPEPQTHSPPGLDDLDGLMQAGRLEDAFVLVRGRLTSGTPPPVEETWTLAERLLAAGRLDEGFALVRELANGGHGLAAFALAEMYDPLHWSADRSPFPKPNGVKALDWYRRAAEAGIGEAEGRSKALAAAGEGP